MNDITLYAYVTSPYAMKVHAYLLYKNLDFNVIYVNPLKAKKELPVGQQVPVLTIDGENKPESQDIGLWLDELYPDSPQLVYGDEAQRKKILDMDNWIAENLIIYMFNSVYTRFNKYSPFIAANTMKLGKTVCKTTNSDMPQWIWRIWPLLLRSAPFIKVMVEPYKNKDIREFRTEIMTYLENILSKQDYLVLPDEPTMPDISAWPLFMVPNQIGLKGTGDFRKYPGIHAWLKRISPMIGHHQWLSVDATDALCQEKAQKLPSLLPAEARQ